MAVIQNNAEGGTAEGLTVTTANSGGLSGDAFNTITGPLQFSATGKGHGTYGLRVVVGATSTAWRAYHSFTATATLSGRLYFTLNTLPSAIRTLWAAIEGTGFSANMKWGVDATNKFFVQSAAGSVLATSAAALAAATLYRVEWQTAPGTTTTDGTIILKLFAGEDNATPLLTYSAANINAGAGKTVVRGSLGNNDPVTNLDVTYDDIKYDTGQLAFLGPVGANAAPTIAFTTPNVYVTAGTNTITGTLADSDGTVKTAVLSVVSGPDSPTVTTNTAGLNTSSCTASADVVMAPGVYVFALDGTDNLNLAGTQARMTAWVSPVALTGATVKSRSGSNTLYGSAATIVAGYNDTDPTTGSVSGAAPAGSIERLAYNPCGLGDLTFNIEGGQIPTSPIVTRQAKVYKADGTTLIYTSPPWALTGTATNHAVTPSDLSSIPALSDRAALIVDVIDTSA